MDFGFYHHTPSRMLMLVRLLEIKIFLHAKVFHKMPNPRMLLLLMNHDFVLQSLKRSQKKEKAKKQRPPSPFGKKMKIGKRKKMGFETFTLLINFKNFERKMQT